ncbi:MAG: hypothetical protein JW740_02400 [Candidatus Zambryskibacteria bacterium]|nr:hypothetical protein [Candidatus Zambryskibacteria bacterium]
MNTEIIAEIKHPKSGEIVRFRRLELREKIRPGDILISRRFGCIIPKYIGEHRVLTYDVIWLRPE